MQNNNKYNLVAENTQSTVVSEYTPDKKRASHYQSEAELERAFIEQLGTQAYEYINISSEADLVQNLRKQLEKLNDFEFTDSEWDHFFMSEIANPNQSIAEKTATIQEDFIKNLMRIDGTVKNLYLLRKDNIHHNSLQVINQYSTEDGQRANRYDVTVLVNGLPLVHVELKRRGVAIQEAFNQINRYQRESFWAGSGLFEYVQLFVISNGTHTKYYSNTTRSEHI
ncbi:MAG: type I restriction endonuclease, partial [Bacteroidota bacterium]